MRPAEHTRITWSDGCRWTAADDSYLALRAQLDRLRDSVVGLDAQLDRWPLEGCVSIDDFAPSEDDRAVFTAALLRARDESPVDREALGLRTDEALGRYLGDLARLAELAQTDITW